MVMGERAMKQQRVSYRFAGVMVACLFLGGLQMGRAAVVFDDDFTGNSGGMPANWSRVFGTGAVVEQGTTVTLGDDEVVIGSDATIDPSSGTVTIETEFVGIVGQGASGLVVPPAFPVTFFFCAIQLEDGRIEVTAGDDGGALQC
jgi:hypothetical protein